MSIRNTPFAEGEFYHIYNRGNFKRKIFLDKKDYERFLKLLFVCNSTKSINTRDLPKNFDPGEPLVAIGSFCLMPNHFHILVKEIIEGGTTRFMQRLGTAYVTYFNKKHETAGSLFEGKFRSEYAGSNNYLKYLYAYIHLNPIKLVQSDWKEKGLQNKKRSFDFLEKYMYSSYPIYTEMTGLSQEFKKIIAPKHFPGYFEKAIDHKNELLSWLDFDLPLGKA